MENLGVRTSKYLVDSNPLSYTPAAGPFSCQAFKQNRISVLVYLQPLLQVTEKAEEKEDDIQPTANPCLVSRQKILISKLRFKYQFSPCFNIHSLLAVSRNIIKTYQELLNSLNIH